MVKSILVGALVGLLGCRTTAVKTDPIETVGALSNGPSTWHAPTHATTDFGHAEIVDTADDSLSPVVTTVSLVDGGEHDGSSPEIVDKNSGFKLGEVR